MINVTVDLLAKATGYNFTNYWIGDLGMKENASACNTSMSDRNLTKEISTEKQSLMKSIQNISST